MTVDSANRDDQLYVATDLAAFPAKSDWRLASDVRIDGKLYRRLDAAYYCWIRLRMEFAHEAYEQGRLAATFWQRLKERFRPVHAWAIAHIGLEAINAVYVRFDAKRYAYPGAAPVRKEAR